MELDLRAPASELVQILPGGGEIEVLLRQRNAILKNNKSNTIDNQW